MRARRRTLAFEQFESRRLMAVTTSLSAGTLTITGDAAADDIAIVGTDRPGELTITGRNGTAINGIADGSVTISGVTGNLTVDSGAGGDVLSLDNVYIARSITITTGDGNDHVTLAAEGEVSPLFDLEINTGSGDDEVHELNYAVFVGQSNFIVLGPGDDMARLIGTSASGGRNNNVIPIHLPGIPNSIFVHGDAGHDSILGVGLTSTWNLQIDGDSGINSLAVLNSSGYGVHVRSGNSRSEPDPGGGGTIYLDTNYARTSISAEAAPFRTPSVTDNSITVFRCHSTTLEVNVQSGNNRVNVYGNAVNGPPFSVHNGGVSPYFIISVGGGRNIVQVTYNVGIRVSVILGDGDDSVTLIGNTMTQSTELNTGGGTNDVFQYDNSLGEFTWHNQL
jgi:hypothetical protein